MAIQRPTGKDVLKILKDRAGLSGKELKDTLKKTPAGSRMYSASYRKVGKKELGDILINVDDSRRTKGKSIKIKREKIEKEIDRKRQKTPPVESKKQASNLKLEQEALQKKKTKEQRLKYEEELRDKSRKEKISQAMQEDIQEESTD